ncbi:hypothetical protein IWZ00DRAFT_575761 [Phyllosticta capitalensis]
MDGDQRRTSALKQTIVKLEQENQTLKEVIQEICMAQDMRSAVEVTRRLPVNDFQGLGDVAALLKRRQSTIDDAVGEKALAETRAGRNSAEESMDIGDVAPQDINIDPVLKSANTTHGAPMPFPPPASLDRAALSNSKGPAQSVHIKSPRKRDLLAYPVGWLSERVLGDTGDAINAQLMYLMEGGIPAPTEDLTVTEFAASVVGQMSFPSRAERLAIFYLVVNFLNVKEYHHMIPDCVKPTAEQSLVPHPAWVDYLPWPRLRNEFISRPDLARRGNALSAFSQYTRVNWPSEYALPFDYRARDWRVEERGPALEQLPDAFKAHVADVNNWSLDPGVVNLYRDIVFVDKVWIQPLEAAEMSHDSMMFDV